MARYYVQYTFSSNLMMPKALTPRGRADPTGTRKNISLYCSYAAMRNREQGTANGGVAMKQGALLSVAISLGILTAPLRVTAQPLSLQPAAEISSVAATKSHHDNIETAGQVVAIALPVVAGGISAYKDDWNGVGQLMLATGATVGTAYLLKFVVHEERPDHSDNQSFPSDTAALAYAPADYLWRRYGWQYGVPAYIAAAFVGYSRVEAKQHYWWDVAASSALAFGFNWMITSRYHPWRGNLQAGASVTPDGGFIEARYTF